MQHAPQASSVFGSPPGQRGNWAAKIGRREVGILLPWATLRGCHCLPLIQAFQPPSYLPFPPPPHTAEAIEIRWHNRLSPQVKYVFVSTQQSSDLPMNRQSPQSGYAEVPVDEIHVPNWHRPLDEGKVTTLAKSISEIGLLQPIGLLDSGRLIYGGHRLAAYRELGLAAIPAVILTLDDLHAELAEIDENLQRSTLTVLETCKALARRKDIYETLHPDTRPITKRGGPGRGKKTSAKCRPFPSQTTRRSKTASTAAPSSEWSRSGMGWTIRPRSCCPIPPLLTSRTN